MTVHVSILAIILSTVASLIIGTFWYAYKVFGKSWMKAIGTDKKDMRKRMPQAMGGLIVTSIITAYALSLFTAYIQVYYGKGFMISAILASLIVWVGFAVTSMATYSFFDPRDKKVLYINAGNRLVTLVAMGIIIGALMK
jgi:uncharacterized protein YneF (UPF0154 family)